jgi:hypothetical protein
MARYTPEFIEAIRRRYEDTDDTLAAMAAEFGISERSINRMRDREHWSRRSERTPRTPEAVRLLDEATALLAAAPPPSPSPASAPENAEADGGSVTERIARLERLVEKEIAAEEHVRAQLGTLPRTPADGERSARTLATLTRTLHALQRLRCGAGLAGSAYDDDVPADIEEFRRELTRRLRAVLVSEIGEERLELGQRIEKLADDEVKEVAGLVSAIEARRPGNDDAERSSSSLRV